MIETDCYECYWFRLGGHWTCQKSPRPYHAREPTDDPLAIYFVPHSVDWRHPDGISSHCNSFVQYFKDTLF